MTDRNTDAESDANASTDTDVPVEAESARPTEPQSADGDVSPCYQAYVERNEHRPDVCTIYSAVSRGTLEETWIRAVGSAFVSRDDAR